MGRMNDGTLYDALEEVLKVSKEPQTCVDLYANPLINKIAESSNRVSDYLGNMWRAGEVLRYPAPPHSGSAARWAYAVKPKMKKKHAFGEPVDPPKPFKGQVRVVEGDDEISVFLLDYVITLKPRK